MAATVLTPAQLEMLKMMSNVTDPKVLDELKEVVSNFFARKANEEINRMWESGELTEEKVNSFKKLHERTHYKC